MESANNDVKQQKKETMKRSVVKTVFYRILIIILDFTTVYIFTGQVKVAFGFMLVSNIYTSIAYFLYDRIWGKIKWGMKTPIN